MNNIKGKPKLQCDMFDFDFKGIVDSTIKNVNQDSLIDVSQDMTDIDELLTEWKTNKENLPEGFMNNFELALFSKFPSLRGYFEFDGIYQDFEGRYWHLSDGSLNEYQFSPKYDATDMYIVLKPTSKLTSLTCNTDSESVVYWQEFVDNKDIDRLVIESWRLAESDTNYQYGIYLLDSNDVAFNNDDNYYYEFNYTMYKDAVDIIETSDETGNRIQLAKAKQYSLDEVLTGDTWIDGKPIYRKVIYLDSLPDGSKSMLPVDDPNYDPNARTKSFATNIENADVLVNSYGYCYDIDPESTTWGKGFTSLPYYDIVVDDSSGIPNLNIGPRSISVTVNSVPDYYLKEIRVSCYNNRTNKTGFYILEYTKTTD
jgi:hypothetical protein